MPVNLVRNSGKIDLTKKMFKGDDGGYYIPAVDENGVLTWTGSEEDMQAVPSSNIKGENGEAGKSGVYVGTEEPIGEELVWINPDGTESTGIATKEYVDEAVKNVSVDLSNYYTKEEVDALIPPSSEEVAY